VNNELFGFEINVWFDALARVGIIVGFMTVTVMALIYIERKILARFQMRLGPTRTGPRGTLQSVADALKLVGKEDLRPRMADPWTFELAPYVVFVPIFLGFVILPFLLDWHVRILELGLLYFVAVSSVNIVGWVMAGWGSDNRYAMIGGLRAAAQGISYELPLVLALLAAAMLAGSLNLNTIVVAQAHIPYIVWQPLAFFIFFVAALAPVRGVLRHPLVDVLPRGIRGAVHPRADRGLGLPRGLGMAARRGAGALVAARARLREGGRAHLPGLLGARLGAAPAH